MIAKQFGVSPMTVQTVGKTLRSEPHQWMLTGPPRLGCAA